MILTVYFQALKETDPASHKVTSGRWGKIYGTSLKEKLDLEQSGKIHLPWSYLDSKRDMGEREGAREGEKERRRKRQSMGLARLWVSAASCSSETGRESDSPQAWCMSDDIDKEQSEQVS